MRLHWLACPLPVLSTQVWIRIEAEATFLEEFTPVWNVVCKPDAVAAFPACIHVVLLAVISDPQSAIAVGTEQRWQLGLCDFPRLAT